MTGFSVICFLISVYFSTILTLFPEFNTSHKLGVQMLGFSGVLARVLGFFRHIVSFTGFKIQINQEQKCQDFRRFSLLFSFFLYLIFKGFKIFNNFEAQIRGLSIVLDFAVIYTLIIGPKSPRNDRYSRRNLRKKIHFWGCIFSQTGGHFPDYFLKIIPWTSL